MPCECNLCGCLKNLFSQRENQFPEILCALHSAESSAFLLGARGASHYHVWTGRLAPHFLASCLASVLGAFASLPLALGTLALIFKLHPVPRCAPCPGAKAPALPGCQEQGRCHQARGQAYGKTPMAFRTNRDYLEPPQIKCHWVWWWFSGFLFGVCEFRGVAAWEELAERLGVVKRER